MILRPYQETGAQWLAGRRRAYLADEPRVGKTPTVARALQLADATSVLVVAPAMVRTHWQRILAEVAPDVAAEVRSYQQIALGGETLRDTLLTHDSYSHLVLDEAHDLRNATAKRTKLLLGKGGYARRIQSVWALSGTPAWKHVGNLWTVFSTLFPAELQALGIRTLNDWYDRFTVFTWEAQQYGPPKRRIWRMQNEAQLHALLDKVMLRRKLSDTGMDVPPISWGTLTLNVDTSSPEDRDLVAEKNAIEAVHAWIGGGDEPSEEKAPGLAVMRHTLGDAKADAVAEYVADELRGSDEARIVLFAYHHSVLDKLQNLLAEFRPVRVDGKTPEQLAWMRIDEFQRGQTRLFIGQNTAVSVGIPLDAATVAIFVEPEWTANLNFQLSQRIVALGDARPKVVLFAAVANTLDEAIQRRHTQEAEMQVLLHG